LQSERNGNHKIFDVFDACGTIPITLRYSFLIRWQNFGAEKKRKKKREIYISQLCDKKWKYYGCTMHV